MTKLSGVAASLCVGLGLGQSALALESISPIMPGATIGVPVGALPPPGIYMSESFEYFNLHIYDQNGRSTGVRASEEDVVSVLTYVPAIPQILGASYGAYIVEPVRTTSVGIPGAGTFTDFGVVNTWISPLNLSWNLENGFFVSLGVSFSPQNTAPWTVSRVSNVGRNYSTGQIDFGLSYLANGWEITLHPMFDFNTVNPANGYLSGDLFQMDYTVSHKFGALKLGVAGCLTNQFTNDRVNGISIASVPNSNGYGNRASEFSVGPVFSYDFGPATLSAYYTRDVYVRNYGGGDRFYARLDVPLYSANPAKATEQDTIGRR